MPNSYFIIAQINLWYINDCIYRQSVIIGPCLNYIKEVKSIKS